jgi:hypothetical protein
MLSFTVNEYTVYTHLKNKKDLPEPLLPFCGHWLFTKITNKQRAEKKPIMTEVAFDKAFAGLIKKLVVKEEYEDRFYLKG